MADVHGLVGQVQWVPRSTELTAAAASSAVTLYVESTVDFDDAGGDLELNGVFYSYESCDEDASTITLSTGLLASAAIDDVVSSVAGGQVAIDYTAFVATGEGDDVEVLIAYADRTLWPEGVYTDPVPVILSADLERIVSVPGRTPVIHGVTFETDSEGSRMAMVPDVAGGVLNWWTGIDEAEIPGFLNPTIDGGLPGVQMAPSTTPTYNERPVIRMFSGDGTGINVITLDAGDGATYIGGNGFNLGVAIAALFEAPVIDFDAPILRTVSPWTITGETWHAITLTSPFTATAQTPQYRLDAAGNVHLRGAVNRVSATSGAAVFTLPSGYRPTAAWSAQTRIGGTVADQARLDITTAGAATLSFPGTPTSIGIEAVFSTL